MDHNSNNDTDIYNNDKGITGQIMVRGLRRSYSRVVWLLRMQGAMMVT